MSSYLHSKLKLLGALLIPDIYQNLLVSVSSIKFIFAWKINLNSKFYPRTFTFFFSFAQDDLNIYSTGAETVLLCGWLNNEIPPGN